MHNNLHIFADDCLRLTDNPSLLNSLETSKTLHTVYIIKYTKKKSPNYPPIHRTKFLLETLHCLQTQLGEFGIPLYIMEGPIITTIQSLVLKWEITRVTVERQTSCAGKIKINVLANFLAAHGVKLVTELSNTLYDITKIQPNIKQEQFLRITEKMTPLSPVSADAIGFLSKFKSTKDPEFNTSIPDITKFEIPDSKLSQIDSKFKGGELEAIKQLENRVAKPEERFSESFPLSPALNFGCISPRFIYEYINKNSVDPKTANEIATGLKKRDYFILIGGHCQNIDNQASRYNYILPWDENGGHVKKFEAGQTGFPIVDAIITQIKKEGYIPTVLRSILAKFLTCGMLWLGWHHGVKLFYEWILDYNPSICGLSWMHSACSTWLRGDIEPGATNPIEEARALDPEGKYIKQYLPHLLDFPPEFVHTPWRAPLELQEKIGCVIGEDYPQPLYPEPEKRFIHCKNRLIVFYALIKNAYNKEPLHTLGKRKLDRRVTS